LEVAVKPAEPSSGNIRVTVPALQLSGASMAFGGITVLNDVSLSLARGETRALVGKNGSGKSTLIKILSGFHRPLPGTTLHLGERRFHLPAAPEALREAGLSFVHQDLALNPDASILDNVLVGRFASRGLTPIAWRQESARVERALATFGVTHSPHRLVRHLQAVDRALVAIARGYIDAREHGGVMVLDEPSAFLTEADVKRLFAAIRQLAAAGTAVIYVSHRLDEVLSLADTVTVLRDGVVVHEGPAAALTEDALIGHILGEDIRRFYPDLAPARDDVVLEADGICGALVKSLSFRMHRGEIVGITGLSGAGFEELPYLLSGASPSSRGTVAIGGRTFPARLLRPHVTSEQGLALLPADRQRASGAQRLSVRENLSLPVLDRFFSFGRLDGRAERKAVRAILHRYNVRPPDPDVQLYALSGGNQQKALFGKWMQTNPDILLLHEPTQGVDVGSKQEIFREIEKAAASGVAVLIASSEAEDLANLCHRVVVLRRGLFAGELAGAELTEQTINNLAFRESSPVADHAVGKVAYA
jgi:ribose transport system ATP-binding protein